MTLPLSMNSSSFTALRIVYSFLKYRIFEQDIHLSNNNNNNSVTATTTCENDKHDKNDKNKGDIPPFLSLRVLALLRNIDEMKNHATLKDFQNAVQFLLTMEKYILNQKNNKKEDLMKKISYESIAGREIIKNDTTNRIGELAVTSMALFSSSAMEIWQLWAKRDAKAQVAMLKLLLK
mmetsp:Transcript_36962/g.47774  ORF Transcript_36962/g.47774 Transcript_36962/m.47774 type:complete len:178 (-) Transcript_36962:24-557(-)